MKAYQITEWDRRYENAQSRKCRTLSWIPIPNKHDGKGYKRLMKREDAPQIFAAWILILEVASRCATRGLLVDSDGAISAEDLADKTDFPQEHFELAFSVLTNGKIGWLCKIDIDESPSPLVARSEQAPSVWERGGAEQNRREQKEQNSTLSESETALKEAFKKNYHAYATLVDEPDFRNVSPEQFMQVYQMYPRVAPSRGVDHALKRAALLAGSPTNPAAYLRARFAECADSRYVEPEPKKPSHYFDEAGREVFVVNGMWCYDEEGKQVVAGEKLSSKLLVMAKAEGGREES